MKDKTAIKKMIEKLKTLKSEGMYLDDFFLTWDKTDDELAAVFQVAEILRAMRKRTSRQKCFQAVLEFPTSAIIQREPGSALQAPVTCLAWRFRI